MPSSKLAHALILVSLSLSIGGCSFLDPDTDAKTLVGQSLKDPSTALFTEMNRSERGTCGYVNSKNSYGAYSGEQAFIVADGDIEFENGSAEFHKKVGERCSMEFYSKWALADSKARLREAEELAASLKRPSQR